MLNSHIILSMRMLCILTRSYLFILETRRGEENCGEDRAQGRLFVFRFYISQKEYSK